MIHQPDDTNPQVARHLRREPLLMLLSRMQRGVLLAAERPLLRAAVETELADGDDAQTQATQCGELLEAAEQAGNTAEIVRAELVADNERLRATLVAVRAIVGRLAAHAVGFQDVLDESDRGPWGNAIGTDIADLQAALDDTQAVGPGAFTCPHIREGGCCSAPGYCCHACEPAGSPS